MGFYENMTIVVVVRPAWRLGLHGFLLEVRRSAMLHYTVNQHLHRACQQYAHSGGTQGWLCV